ncbi:MAG: hypothetical protein AAGI53_10665 [Planctomycetota bacterium]
MELDHVNDVAAGSSFRSRRVSVRRVLLSVYAVLVVAAFGFHHFVLSAGSVGWLIGWVIPTAGVLLGTAPILITLYASRRSWYCRVFFGFFTLLTASIAPGFVLVHPGYRDELFVGVTVMFVTWSPTAFAAWVVRTRLWYVWLPLIFVSLVWWWFAAGVGLYVSTHYV